MRGRLGFVAEGGSADMDYGWVQEQGSHAQGHWLEGAEGSTVSSHVFSQLVHRDSRQRTKGFPHRSATASKTASTGV